MKKVFFGLLMGFTFCSCSQNAYFGIAKVYNEKDSLVATLLSNPSYDAKTIRVENHCVKFDNAEFQYPTSYRIESKVLPYSEYNRTATFIQHIPDSVYYRTNAFGRIPIYHLDRNCEILKDSKHVIATKNSRWVKEDYPCKFCATKIKLIK